MRFQAQAGSNYRVLVVDDDRTSLELSCASLVQQGFTTDKARSGVEAISLCKSYVYDIIFMDIEMPNLDGYNTARAIRNLKKGATNAYIIALSGRLENQAQLQKCMESGMNDCIVKPLCPKILEKKLSRWKQKA